MTLAILGGRVDAGRLLDELSRSRSMPGPDVLTHGAHVDLHEIAEPIAVDVAEAMDP